eukprot:g713.t1
MSARCTTPASYTRQLRALLRKNWTLKRRNPCAFVCEIIAPILFATVLVLGYALSDSTLTPAGIYAQPDLNAVTPLEILGFTEYSVPDDDGAGAGPGMFGPKQRSRRQLSARPGLLAAAYDDDSPRKAGEWLLDPRKLNTAAPPSDGQGRQPAGNSSPQPAGNGSPGRRRSSNRNSGGYRTSDLYDVRDALASLMAGPLSVPSFDAFVGAHLAISRNIDPRTMGYLNTYNRYARDFGNLLTLGTLHFAPDSLAVRQCVDYLNRTTRTFRQLDVRIHASEDAAIDDVLEHVDERRTWAVVIMDDASDASIDYTLRLNYTTVPNTNWVVRWIARGLSIDYQRYFTSGFLTLQNSIDKFFFDRAKESGRAQQPRWRSGTGVDLADRVRGETDQLSIAGASANDGRAALPRVNVTNSPGWLPPVVGTPMPTAAFDQNLFYSAAGFLIGMVLTMATAYPTARLVKVIVEEKESRMKELLLITGLSPSVFYLSWFITALVPFTASALGVTWLLTSSFIRFSSPSLVFTYVFLFFMSEIALAFLIASFFSRAKLATYFAYVFIFVAMLPKYVFFGTNRYENPGGKMATSLLSPSAFSFGADTLADYELSDQGVTWANMNDGDYSFAHTLDFMFLDIWLYAVLAWYFNNTIQGQYGHALPWYFPLTSTYWIQTFGNGVFSGDLLAGP